MYLRSWFLISGVLALNEHVTVCPSSVSVELPSVTSEYTIALTLTNSGTETARLTLLPNDTYNNPRERVWRASEAYAPLLVPRDEATTTEPVGRAIPLLSDAALRFHNDEVPGHGVMIAHGDLESHPDLEMIMTTPLPVATPVVGAKSRPRWQGRSPSRKAWTDWHTVVLTRSIAQDIPNCMFVSTDRRSKHREIFCKHILGETMDCQARAFWLDDGTHLELRFPKSCSDRVLTNAINLWTRLVGGGAVEVEADEQLLVQSDDDIEWGGLELLEKQSLTGGLRGGDPAGGRFGSRIGSALAGKERRLAGQQSFDPSWPNEWQYGYMQYAFPLLMINATKQWPLLAQYPIASSPTTMIIDTYAQLDHDDLVMNYAVNEAELNGKPGVDDDGDGVIDNIYGLDGVNIEMGDPGWSGSISHGTSVSGLVAARPNNDLGAVGIAPQSRVLPCGTGNSTMSMLATVACMNWAYENAKRFNLRVINHSYTGASYSSYQAATFAKLQDIGMIHTVATGNTNVDMDTVEPPTPILYLATEGLYSLIGVARLDKEGKPAPSGYSTEWTNFYMPGELTIIVPPNGDEIAIGSGTSFAAPTTAGIIASMLTVRPELDIFDVLWILENSIHKLDTVSDLCRYQGFVNASQAIQNAVGTWIKPINDQHRYVTLAPGETKTVQFTVTLQDGSDTSRTAYIAILGANDTRLSGVYKMGEVPVTVSLSKK